MSYHALRMFRHLLEVSLILLGLSLLTACPNKPLIANHPETPPRPAARPPVRFLLFQDVSLSTQQTRTPQLTLGQLKMLLGIVQQRGGEIALGSIGADSNHNLLRLRIDPPPSAPVREKQPNPLLEQQQKKQFAHVQATYEHEWLAWQEKTTAAITAFLDDVHPLLMQPPRARRTDLYGAFRRANLFFQEDARSWGRAVDAYAIFITDGLDDAKREPVSLELQGAVLIVINGSATLGVFESLHPQLFESIGAACYALAATERKE